MRYVVMAPMFILVLWHVIHRAIYSPTTCRILGHSWEYEVGGLAVRAGVPLPRVCVRCFRTERLVNGRWRLWSDDPLIRAMWQLEEDGEET